MVLLKIPLLFLLVVVWEVASDEERPVATTSGGKVRGKVDKALGKELYSFLGIPYAEPPVGDLRFKRPKPTRWKGILEATKWSLPCYQYRAMPIPWLPLAPYTEDCLTLNFWVPRRKDKKGDKRELLDIMVYIHGGTHSGSSNMDTFDGRILSVFGNVIIASINYRGGIFGFLNVNTEDASGNMGFYDQVMALKWIKRNAMAFGGDPRKITLFAESYGSVCIGLHLLSPLSRDLFTRAIMETGSAYQPFFKGDNRALGPIKAEAFAQYVGCSNATVTVANNASVVVECLRNKNPKELAKAESDFWVNNTVWFYNLYGDEFMPRDPIAMIHEGDFKNVDLLAGDNSNEGSNILLLFLPPFYDWVDRIYGSPKPPDLTVEEGRNLLIMLFNGTGLPAEQMADLYLSNITSTKNGAVVQALFQIFGDFSLLCPTVTFAKIMAEAKNNVYFYYFDHYPTPSPWRRFMAMAHYEASQFVFGVPLRNLTDYTKEERDLSRYVMTKWTNFAKYGKPDFAKKNAWPKFTKKEELYLELKLKTKKIRASPHDEYCDFWNAIALASAYPPTTPAAR